MPIMSVIKNTAGGDILCYKFPHEDFNVGSQLIVAEYEEALFVQDGVVEQVFGPGRYTLDTSNYPFITKLRALVLTGGVNAFNCKVYYINHAHHLELKWGTGTPVRLIDPVWGIEVHVQARGSYSVVVKESKKFFIKLVGAHANAVEQDIVKNFRTAFIQNITDEMAEYLASGTEEVLVVCNRKKKLTEELKGTLNNVLDEYGMELVNFYIETVEIPENDSCMQRIRELRIQRQEKMFEREQAAADERLRFGLSRESAEAERYVSGQQAQADYERMKIRDQDGNNGWARQETAEILHEAVQNEGMGSTFMNMGVGLGVGAAVGGMVKGMTNNMAYDSPNNAGGLNNPGGPNNAGGQLTQICPKCNAVLPAGLKFCGSCGSPMEAPKRICANCGAEVPENMKFCGQCGTPVTPAVRICPKCNNEVAPSMKFCGICGTKVD